MFAKERVEREGAGGLRDGGEGDKSAEKKTKWKITCPARIRLHDDRRLELSATNTPFHNGVYVLFKSPQLWHQISNFYQAK